MKAILHTGLFSLLLVLGSCLNSQFYQDYSNKIDSLNASLEASASSFEQFDTATLAAQKKVIVLNLDSLGKLTAYEPHGLVNDYSYIKKSYKTILREYPLAIEELQYSRKQLSDLKHDIEHKHLDEEMIKSYFSHEEEAISLLKLKMELLNKTAREEMNKFERLNPQIEIMIDSLSVKD